MKKLIGVLFIFYWSSTVVWAQRKSAPKETIIQAPSPTNRQVLEFLGGSQLEKYGLITPKANRYLDLIFLLSRIIESLIPPIHIMEEVIRKAN